MQEFTNLQFAWLVIVLIVIGFVFGVFIEAWLKDRQIAKMRKRIERQSASYLDLATSSIPYEWGWKKKRS